MSRFWHFFFRLCLQVFKVSKIWHSRLNLRYQVLKFLAYNMHEILYLGMTTSCEQFRCLLHTSFPKFAPCISREKTLSMFRRSTLVSQRRCKIVRRLYSCTVIFFGYVSGQAHSNQTCLTYPVLRAYTPKKSCKRRSNKSKKISNFEQRIINVNKCK